MTDTGLSWSLLLLVPLAQLTFEWRSGKCWYGMVLSRNVNIVLPPPVYIGEISPLETGTGARIPGLPLCHLTSKFVALFC